MNKKIRKLLLDHLNEVGTEGTYFEKAYEACKDKIGNVIDLEDAKKTAAYSEWRKIDRDEMDADGEAAIGHQFCLSGIQTKSVIRYEDKSVPGGFRTVLTYHATVGQGRLAHEFQAEQLRKVERSVVNFGIAIAEAELRAGGDLTVLLRDVADEEMSFGTD